MFQHTTWVFRFWFILCRFHYYYYCKHNIFLPKCTYLLKFNFAVKKIDWFYYAWTFFWMPNYFFLIFCQLWRWSEINRMCGSKNWRSGWEIFFFFTNSTLKNVLALLRLAFYSIYPFPTPFNMKFWIHP